MIGKERLREIEKRRVAFRNWEAFCAEGYELLDNDVPALIAALREAKSALRDVQGELALANQTIYQLRDDLEIRTATGSQCAYELQQAREANAGEYQRGYEQGQRDFLNTPFEKLPAGVLDRPIGEG